MVSLLGMTKHLLGLFPVQMKYLASSITPTPDVASAFYIPFCSLEKVTLLGLRVGGLVLLLCTLFSLGANSLSSLDSRLLRFFRWCC